MQIYYECLCLTLGEYPDADNHSNSSHSRDVGSVAHSHRPHLSCMCVCVSRSVNDVADGSAIIASHLTGAQYRSYCLSAEESGWLYKVTMQRCGSLVLCVSADYSLTVYVWDHDY